MAWVNLLLLSRSLWHPPFSPAAPRLPNGPREVVQAYIRADAPGNLLPHVQGIVLDIPFGEVPAHVPRKLALHLWLLVREAAGDGSSAAASSRLPCRPFSTTSR